MKKDLRIEKMRIIACLMVILNHVSAAVYLKYDIGSFKWHIFNIYDSLSQAAVPIFVMISGILLLNNSKELDIKKIYKKYIPKMLIILILGSLGYALWYSYGLGIINHDFKTIIKKAITGPSHLWYLSVIIFLYIMTPILRKITMHNDEKTTKYFFWVLLISSLLITIKASVFLPYHEYIKTAISKIYLEQILIWSSYFLLGYYIYNTNYLDKYKKLAYGLGIVGLLFRILLTVYVCTKYGANDFTYYNNIGFTVFGSTIALAFLMKSFKQNEKHRKIIENVSKTTLGIYIIHMIFIHCITAKLKYDLANSMTIVTIPIAVILVFIASFIVTFIYKKLIGLLKQTKAK